MQCLIVLHIFLLVSIKVFDFCSADEDEKIHIKIIMPEIIKHSHTTKVVMMKGNKKKPEKKPSKNKKPHETHSGPQHEEDHNHSFIESFIRDSYKETQHHHIPKKPHAFTEFIGHPGPKFQKYKFGFPPDKDVKAHKLVPINGPYHIDDDTTIIDAFAGHTGHKRQVKHPKGMGYSTSGFSGNGQNDWHPIKSSANDPRSKYMSLKPPSFVKSYAQNTGGYKVHETPEEPPPNSVHRYPATSFLSPVIPKTPSNYLVNVRYASTAGQAPSVSSISKPLILVHEPSGEAKRQSQALTGYPPTTLGATKTSYASLQTNSLVPSSVGSMYSKFTQDISGNGPTSVQYAVQYTHPSAGTTASTSPGSVALRNAATASGTIYSDYPNSPVSYSTNSATAPTGQQNDVQSAIKYVPCPTATGQDGNCLVIMDSRNLANTHYSSIVTHPISSASEPVANYAPLPSSSTIPPLKVRTRKDVTEDQVFVTPPGDALQEHFEEGESQKIEKTLKVP